MKTATAEQPTVGRPAADVKIPRGKFTFQQLCEANSNLAPLTLRNFMKRDKGHGKLSQIVRVEDERGEPGSDDGYGRKPFLYVRRELLGKTSSGGVNVRNVGYHVHKAKAPSHTMKRTELKNGRPHIHRVIDLSKKSLAGGASVTISFAPVPNGAPVPTSVTVNFNPRSKSSSPAECITVEQPQTDNNCHEKTLPDATASAPTEASKSTPPIAAATETPSKT